MVDSVQYITFLLTLVSLDVNAHRRFVLNENVNLTTLVAKLATEVEQLKAEHSVSTITITQLEQKIRQLNQDFEITKTDLKAAKTTIEKCSDSTYVRWGRSTCPDGDTEVVYSGYTGGSNWDDSGAATNFLCLVKDPYLIGNSSYHQGAQVYGAEYVMDNANWQETSRRIFGTDITFQDVPCVVCRIQRATVVMVPGKNTCAGGWMLEYEGVLSSGYYGHKSGSEFVCLDGSPEAVSGGSSKQLGKLFYLTQAVCGSLKCPPYESGKYLTCAVCSK